MKGQVERLGGVGQRYHQRRVAPGAVVGDVHARLALAVGAHDGGVGVDAGRLAHERGALAGPHPQPAAVDGLLEGHGRLLVEATAEVPRRGRVGQGGRPQAVEEDPVVAHELDVAQPGPAAQRVVGDAEHVVGLVIGPVLGQHLHRGVDLGGQADLCHQAGDHPHAAVGHPLGARRELIGDPRPPEHRPARVGRHRPRQPALDHPLFACQRPAQRPLRLAHVLQSVCGKTRDGGCPGPRW